MQLFYDKKYFIQLVYSLLSKSINKNKIIYACLIFCIKKILYIYRVNKTLPIILRRQCNEKTLEKHNSK